MEKRKSIYLDHAATTPTDVSVLEKMLPYYGSEYGNPSSIYEQGRRSAQAISSARQGLAELIGAKREEIIFTGSGTESDNLAILGVARANRAYGDHILVSSVEHKAVIESAEQLAKEGFKVDYIPVDKYGMVDVEQCMKLVNEKTILISVMYANNEIGTIEPIKELGRRIQDFRQQTLDSRKSIQNESVTSVVSSLMSNVYPIFHTDACQAVGYLPINVQELGVDMMTLNGSKIYGPKGIGVLYKKESVNIEPIIFGGGQEMGLRSGTESVPLIVGLSYALEKVDTERESESSRLTLLRDYLIKEIYEKIPDAILNGHPRTRLPNNVHISIPHIEGESVVLMLDELGIQVSTGSACSSHDLEVSHVLTAIGQSPELMHGSIRFTLGKENTKEDVDYLLSALPDIVNRLRNISSSTIKYERQN